MNLTERNSTVIVSPAQREALAALLYQERTALDRLEYGMPSAFPPEYQQRIDARRAALANGQSLYDAIVAAAVNPGAGITHWLFQLAGEGRAARANPGLLQSANTADRHSPA